MRYATSRWTLWCLLACFLPAMAAEHELTLKLSNNVLKPTGTTPTLQPGDTLHLLVEGVGTNQATWSFTADGIAPAGELVTGGLRFSLTTDAGAQDGVLSVVFADSSGTVSMLPQRLRVQINSAASGSSGDERIPKHVYRRGRNEVKLYFDGNGLPVGGAFPANLDDNDKIDIYFYARASEIPQLTVEVQGTLTPEEFSLQGGSTLPDFRKLLASPQGSEIEAQDKNVPVSAGSFGPYSPPSVTITIKKGGTALRSYTLKLNKTYLGSLRYGVINSDVRFNKYALIPDPSTGMMHIANTSDPGGENRDFVSIVFYAWRWWGANSGWNGRDINETPSFSHRFNPFVGFGLDDFGDEYLVGVSFELARGLDLVFGEHVANTDLLIGGFSEGDPFDPMLGSIPVRTDWQNDSFIGVSIDLRVATRALTGLFGGGGN